MKQATKTSVHTGDGNPALFGLSRFTKGNILIFLSLSIDIGIISNAVIAIQYCNTPFSGNLRT